MQLITKNTDSSPKHILSKEIPFSDSQTIHPEPKTAKKPNSTNNKMISNNTCDFAILNDLNTQTKNQLARKAYRAHSKNLWVYLEGNNKIYEVCNISISGICFKFNNADTQNLMQSGANIVLHLFSDTHSEILTVPAQILRTDNDAYSCFFPFLPYRDETILDILILEMQKQEIMQRKLEYQRELEFEKLQLKKIKQHIVMEIQHNPAGTMAKTCISSQLFFQKIKSLFTGKKNHHSLTI